MNKKKLKVRLIPILLFKNGLIVKSRNFNMYQTVGNPFSQVDRYNKWNLDEMIYLNISEKKNIINDTTHQITSSTASGMKYLKDKKMNIFEFIRELSKKCFMPLTYGGGINSLEIARKVLKYGADKICINSYAFKKKLFISECAKEFGSQSVVVSIDCKKINNIHEVFIDNGKTRTGIKVVDWVKKAESLGAGEILINSIDKDGAGMGYDYKLCRKVVKNSNIPVIICGGVGKMEHFADAFFDIKPHALSAANIFQFTENSYKEIKNYLKSKKINLR